MDLPLYKGVFNCNGQDVTLYRHARSLAQAKQYMLMELARLLGLSLWVVRMKFGDWCTNHIIEEVKSDGRKSYGPICRQIQ